MSGAGMASLRAYRNFARSIIERERASRESTVFLGSTREESPEKLRWQLVDEEVDNEVSPEDADHQRQG